MNVKDKKFLETMIEMSGHCSEQFLEQSNAESGVAKAVYKQMASRIREIHDDLKSWKSWKESKKCNDD